MDTLLQPRIFDTAEAPAADRLALWLEVIAETPALSGSAPNTPTTSWPGRSSSTWGRCNSSGTATRHWTGSAPAS